MAEQTTATVADGLMLSELDVLRELARPASRMLEIGMANGSSAVAMLESSAGTLVSIDPYQYEHYKGRGVEAVRERGFDARHRIIAEPDYLVLPDLVSHREVFDFIFIDGYHAFEYAMLDFFYADRLTAAGGVVAFHDSGWPSVFEACRFVNSLSYYEHIGPRPILYQPQRWRRVLSRLTDWSAHADRRARQERWRSVAAYRKTSSGVHLEDDGIDRYEAARLKT